MSMGQSQESTNIDETKETIKREVLDLSLIHISEPTRRVVISYAGFCLK